MINLPADINFTHHPIPNNPYGFRMVPKTRGSIPMEIVKRAEVLSDQGVPAKDLSPTVQRELKLAIQQAFDDSDYSDWLNLHASGKYNVNCHIGSSGGESIGPVIDIDFSDKDTVMLFKLSFI